MKPSHQVTMQSTGDDPRWIVRRPSRLHLALVLAGCALALGVLLWVPLPMALRVGLMLGVGLLCGLSVQCILLKNHAAVAAFYFFEVEDTKAEKPSTGAPRQMIRLRYAHDGGESEAAVCAGAFVSPLFSNIPYLRVGDPAWRRVMPHVITLWRDSLEAEEFRQTRVRLRWK